MSRTLIATILLAGLTVIATGPPPSAPARQDADKKPVVKEKPVVKGSSSTPRSLVTALTTRVSFAGEEDKGLTLKDVLDRLSKQHDLPYTINERAFAVAESRGGATEIVDAAPLPPMRATLGRVISRILERLPGVSPATFLVREDGIEVTTRAFAEAEVGLFRESRPRANPGSGDPAAVPMPVTDEAGAQREGIYVPMVSVAVEREPLEDALRQMRLQANVNIVFDPGSREKARTEVSATLLNAPVDGAMQLLVEMVELDYVWLDNTFYVTSREKAKTLRATWPDRRGGATPRLPGSAAAPAGM